jgi:hypothetical protein
MKSFIRLLLLTLLNFSFSNLDAQNSNNLKGTVQDESGKPVAFGTVNLIRQPDAAVVGGSVTNDAGIFNFESPIKGRYFLRISAIGFVEIKTPDFEVTDSGFSKDFGILVLKQDVTQLKEVTVESMRPAITQEADKMVVKIEGTALAAGNTAFSVLSRMPGVFVDPEGNIRLNGRGGVTLMLDGRITYLSAADLRNMLEAMPAENVKNIEIMTNPSSKFDAEGTSGILNINLKKNTRTGYNGSVYGGYTYNFKQNAYNYGAIASYKTGKWNTFLSVDDARRIGGRDATFTRIFYGSQNTIYFDQNATGNYKNEGPPTVRFGADYTFNDRHELGTQLSFTQNTGWNSFITDTYIGPAADSPVQLINAKNYGVNMFTSLKGNLHYLMKIDTLGTTVSSDLDVIKIRNRGYSHFLNYFNDLESATQAQDFLYTEVPNDLKIYAIKADLVCPFGGENKIEAGVKASRVNTDTDSRFYFNNAGLVLDPLRTNHFIYTESILAAYISWNTPLTKKLALKTGLRAENTDGKGNSLTTNQVNTRNYVDFFPSLFLQHKVSDNYEINYNYTRRITRPNYGNLNPFRAYRDPHTWWEGNPYLRPQYTHAVSVAQTFKKTYILTLNYNYDKDLVSEIPILDAENGTTVYTIGNIDHGQTAYATLLVPVKFTKWWDSQNTGSCSYSELQTTTENGALQNDRVSYTLQSNHTMKLPSNVKMELNLMYQSPAVNGLYLMDAMSRVDIAFRISIFKKKLDVTLKANDLFKGYKLHWTTDINGNRNDFDQYFRVGSIGISLRYNFSQGEKTKSQQNKSIEEMNRI